MNDAFNILGIKMGCGQETSLPKFRGTSCFPATFNKGKMQKCLTKNNSLCLDYALTTRPPTPYTKEMLSIGVLFSASALITGLRNGLSVFILSSQSPNAQ